MNTDLRLSAFIRGRNGQAANVPMDSRWDPYAPWLVVVFSHGHQVE